MTPAAERRLKLRDSLFREPGSRVWDRKTNDGFFTAPRLLPYVLGLIRNLSPKGDPASVYFDLWSRAFDEGIATITDEGAAAFASGYTGPRAIRTWRERVALLAEMGFIETAAAGNRQFAYVLIVNPLEVICTLRRESPEKVPDAFWNAFIARAQEVGASLPIEKKELVMNS